MESRQDEEPSARSWLPAFLRKSKDSKDDSDAVTPPTETTSLLPKPDEDDDDDEPREGETYDLEDGNRTTTQLVAAEFWVLLKGSVPVILAYTLQNSLQTVSVLIVGRLSAEALAVASFSYMFAMATAWLIGMGGTTAIDTLASASFTGSKNKHDLGIILQRAFVILGLFYIPVAILWFCSQPVFKALGQEDYIARDSSKFLMILIPGGLGYIYFECMKKYLQAQGMICSESNHLQQTLTIYRDHATRYLRAADHFAYQRWAELPLCLHLQDGPVRSSDRDRHQLLAVIPAIAGVRKIRVWLGLLGWLVKEVPSPHRALCKACNPRSHTRWHRMVGF